MTTEPDNELQTLLDIISTQGGIIGALAGVLIDKGVFTAEELRLRLRVVFEVQNRSPIADDLLQKFAANLGKKRGP